MVFDRIKVFSATKAKDREHLGERVTDFLREYLNKGGEIKDKKVLQSSDQEFHCYTIVLFLKDQC